MLDSKIFITAYTGRGIVIREEIRMANFSEPILMSHIVKCNALILYCLIKCFVN
jgi:hypothetical protein